MHDYSNWLPLVLMIRFTADITGVFLKLKDTHCIIIKHKIAKYLPDICLFCITEEIPSYTDTCLRVNLTEALPYFCRAPQWTLGSPDSWQDLAGPQGQGLQLQPGRTTDTEQSSDYLRHQCVIQYIKKHMPVMLDLPVDCLHAQILGQQVHFGRRHSQSSLVQCILLEPA